MSLVKLVASTITLVLLTSAAAAGVIDSSVRHVPADPAGAGYIANDLFIDFEGNLRGQQLWLRLDSGSVYAPPQTDSVCTHLTFCLLDPYRSRVGIGDLHNSAVLIIGGAVDIPGAQGELQIDEEGMSVAWAPGIGVDVASGTNLPIARLTLSPDANGTVWLYSLTSGNGPPFLHGDVVIDGFIGGRIPEPASLLLFGIAVTSTIAVGTITERSCLSAKNSRASAFIGGLFSGCCRSIQRSRTDGLLGVLVDLRSLCCLLFKNDPQAVFESEPEKENRNPRTSPSTLAA